MKKLRVPYFEALDVLDLSSVGFLMEKAQRESIDVINWEEYPYKPIVAFDIARSKVNLYIRYFVKGNSLKALFTEDGSPVYQDSCVEFFMKQPDDPNYYNFEFNCIGTWDASYRESKNTLPFVVFQVCLMPLLERSGVSIAGNWWLPFLSG